jgi:hypothetical protein
LCATSSNKEKKSDNGGQHTHPFLSFHLIDTFEQEVLVQETTIQSQGMLRLCGILIGRK